MSAMLWGFHFEYTHINVTKKQDLYHKGKKYKYEVKEVKAL
jgi:hypothetical protein